MDFPLNSSLILAVTVGLWLLWVAPYLFRRSKTAATPAAAASAAAAPAVLPAPSSTAIRSSISADGLSQQGKIMHNDSYHQPGSPATGTGSAPVARGTAGAPETAQPQPDFSIRYGRTALALAGALALAVVVIGLPLALFGAASWWLPVNALLVAAGAVASLRALAVRDRRLRVEAAFRDAMSVGRQPSPAPQPDPEPLPVPEKPVQRRETVLFDRENSAGAKAAAGTGASAEARVITAPGSSDRPLTPAELRTAALESAAASAKKSSDRPAGPPKTSTTPWEPVAVPKPIYVEAPVAQRPVPAPLVPPQTPKSTARTPLRPGAAPVTGKINLDDVLQRRRA